MTSQARIRFLLTILLLVVAIPAAFVLSDSIAMYHASVVRHHGSTVDYGVKGGYFVTIDRTADLPKFLADCGASLDYLSKHYGLTMRLDGRDLTKTDLTALKRIKGTFYLTLRDTKIDESQFEQLISLGNLQGVDTTNAMISEAALERFNQSRSK